MSSTTTTQPTHLILTCCHAIYLPSSPHHGTSEKEDWLLAPFQTDETPTFTAHILAGLNLLLSSPTDALLVFSGSKTRPEIDLSEAASYLALAEENSFWGLPVDKTVKARILLEEQALDSFANLLFSVIAFWRTTGAWPEKITIVTHAFKRARFLDLHAKTLRIPVEKVEFVGIDPKYMDERSGVFDGERAREVRKGERERGFSAWERDVWGTGEVLRGKRMGRNFWGVGQKLFGGEEERRRSGVRTRILEAGDGGVEEEVLDEDGAFPWEDNF